MTPDHFVAIESGIRPYQVLQRNAQGCTDVEFTCRTTVPDGTIVSVRLMEFGQPVPQFPWRAAGRVRNGRCSIRLSDVPTGGEYTIEIRTEDADGRATACTTCHGILVGDIWILAGQSNMQGVGRLKSEHVEAPSPLVHAFDMADRWVTAREPLHWRVQSVDPAHHPADADTSEEGILKEHRTRIAGVGTGMRFAREMVRETGVPVGLIPCAVGGTSMSQWEPRRKHLGGKSLYGAMIRRFQAIGGRVKGMLWYQGESDTGENLPERFADKFRAFVAAVREDTRMPHLPIYYVQIGRFVTEPFRPGWNLVQEAQRTLAEEIADVEVVPAVDAELDDGIHLSAAGHSRVGRRLAVVALRRHFARDDLNVGPRLDRVVVEGPSLVRVKYREVNGRLTAPAEIAGFSVRDAECRSLHIIYRTDVDPEDPSSVLLRLDRPLPQDSYLWYGYGMHPVCNLTDEEDMGAPVFGPLPLAV